MMNGGKPVRKQRKDLALPELSTMQLLELAKHDLLENLNELAAGVTGVAASKREDYALAVGRTFQGLLKGRFLTTFEKEWGHLKSKGRIKEDYEQSKQHSSCLHELFRALDNNDLDEDVFSILKKILIVAATDSDSNKDDVLPQEYMSICRELTSGEALVLFTTYREYKRLISIDDKVGNVQAGWRREIADLSGLQHVNLILRHETGLKDKHLIKDGLDHHNIYAAEGYRLTDLAIAVCEYVDNYEEPEIAS